MQGTSVTVAGLLQRGRGLYGPFWARPDLVGTGVPLSEALRVFWARLDLTRTGVLCCCVRSTTALGGGDIPSCVAAILLTLV